MLGNTKPKIVVLRIPECLSVSSGTGKGAPGEHDVTVLIDDTIADIPVGKFSPEDRKIVLNYTRTDGRLKQIPMQSKKIQAVLNYIYDAFDKERRYTEKEVNQVLARFHPDTSTLRRFLVDFNYLERERDGSVYWCVK